MANIRRRIPAKYLTLEVAVSGAHALITCGLPSVSRHTGRHLPALGELTVERAQLVARDERSSTLGYPRALSDELA